MISILAYGILTIMAFGIMQLFTIHDVMMEMVVYDNGTSVHTNEDVMYHDEEHGRKVREDLWDIHQLTLPRNTSAYWTIQFVSSGNMVSQV